MDIAADRAAQPISTAHHFEGVPSGYGPDGWWPGTITHA